MTWKTSIWLFWFQKVKYTAWGQRTRHAFGLIWWSLYDIRGLKLHIHVSHCLPRSYHDLWDQKTQEWATASTDISLSSCRKGIQVRGPAIVSKALRSSGSPMFVHIFWYTSSSSNYRLNGVTIVNWWLSREYISHLTTYPEKGSLGAKHVWLILCRRTSTRVKGSFFSSSHGGCVVPCLATQGTI